MKRAFTLIELLVVLAIAAVLLALVIPAVGPLLRASSVNNAAAMITDHLNLARQLALAQNRDVEVRLYKAGSKADSADVKFRAFRCLYADGADPKNSRAVSSVIYLPEPVIIAEAPAHSTLLDYTNTGRSGLSKLQETLPGGTVATDYVSFLFRATGGTNLTPINPPTGNWYLTLYLDNAAKNAATQLPDNYVTIQIEPVTGRVHTYRP